jgi:hypothetical protein
MSYRGMHYLIPSLISMLSAATLLHANHHLIARTKVSLVTKQMPQKADKVSQDHKKSNLDVKPPLINLKRLHLFRLISFTLFLTLSVPVSKLANKSDSPRWKTDMQAYSKLSFNCQNSSDFWSDYPGFFLAKSGCKLPTGDLMIHAVSDRRLQYQKNFNKFKPKIVETSTRSANSWMPWLRTTNWAFYESLYANYSPVSETSHSILWERDTKKIRKLEFLGQSNSLELFYPVTSLIVAPRQARFGVLKIEYSIEKPLSFIPLLGELGNFGLLLDGSLYPGEVLSLSPHKLLADFPIYPFNVGGEIRITPINNSPRFFAALRVKKATIDWYKPIEAEYSNFEMLLK